MALKMRGEDTPLNADQREQGSESKSRLTKGRQDRRRKFSIDSLIKADHNISTIDNRCYKFSSPIESSKHGNQNESKPTTSTKRCHEDESSHSVTRSSPLGEQNLFTTSANISRYSVLQVVQPTSSTGTDCSPCFVAQQSSQEQNSVVSQSQDSLLNPSDERIQNSLDLDQVEFIHTSDPPSDMPIQPQSVDTNLGNTPDLTTFMPSLAALATYPMFNWCAKCNASFRVTSELVHHMRTHHKKRKIANGT